MRIIYKNIRALQLLFSLAIIAGLFACASTSQSFQAQSIYRIKIEPGDTLDRIASRYRTTSAAIIQQNNLKSSSLMPGTELLVKPDYKVLTSKKLPPKFLSSYTMPQKAHQISWPAKGWLSSRYGMRWGRLHSGIDIAASLGSTITAAEGGKVIFAGWKRGYGRTVIISHQNFLTLYAHMQRYTVNRGQWVEMGQQIGAIGRSGNARGVHLHFEYRDLDNRPRDPMAFLPDRQMLSLR